MMAEEQLAKRAIREAQRRWGAGWRWLSPEAQSYQVYAQAFVILVTEDLKLDLRAIAKSILNQLHGE